MRNVLVHIRHSGFSLWNLPETLAREWRERFEPRGVRFVFAHEREGFERALPEAEALLGGGLTPQLFPRAERLTWVQTLTTGVAHLTFPALVESEVTVTNTRGIQAVPMAEHLMGMLLALVRKIHRGRDFQREGRWGQETLWVEEPLLDELGGRTLAVVGLGSVGREVAPRAAAFGLRVIGIRRRPGGDPPPGVSEVHGEEGLERVLGSSDFVADCLPETARTRRLFDRDRFAAMKSGSFFFNVGRGTTVDEAALVAAIESGHLAGAALDVTEEEPLPSESPLYRLPRVLLTPHVSGVSIRFWERVSDLFEENLERWLEGEPLRNVVDKREGY